MTHHGDESNHLALAMEAVVQVQTRCASEIERDPREFRERFIADFRREFNRKFRLGPGRPCNKRVTRAEELKSQGKTWAQIYAELDVPKAEQPQLRSAWRTRRLRRSKKTGEVRHENPQR